MPSNYDIIKSSNYVKFVRGTPTAFNNLATKNPDTLYFVSEANADSGQLYLGSKLISGSTSIESIGDIIIDNNLADKDILVYDDTQQAWVNSDINSVIGIMTGATANTNGAAGLVPTPIAGNQDKFLRGDGTWASPMIATDSDIFTTNQNSELTLIGFNDADVGTLLQKDSNGDLQWVDPSTLQTDLTAVEADIDVLQSQVESIISTKLKRQIVNSTSLIDLTKDNIIYMVPDTNGSSGNLYNEYMVVNGEIELIGSSYEGDLTGYVTTSQLNQEVGDLEDLISGLDDRLTAVEGDFVTLTQYDAEVGDLTSLLLTQNHGSTLVDQVNDLTERLTWYLISEQQEQGS